MLLWDTSVVEWYYPALSSGVTHGVVNRSTAIDVISRLNADLDLVEALSRAAKRVQAELVCADCIADFVARVANRTRERMGYGSVLDDADRMLRLAKKAGACDNFVSVEIGDRRNEQHTYAAAGAGLCAALAGSEKAPAVTRSRWAPADEFARLHPNVSSSWRERIVAEANRSVNFFKARKTPAATEELLREMLGPTRRNWRDYAVFVLWGEVFLAKKYFGHVKVAGHGVLLRTAWQRRKFGNVAFLHATEASGGGPCGNFAAPSWTHWLISTQAAVTVIVWAGGPTATRRRSSVKEMATGCVASSCPTRTSGAPTAARAAFSIGGRPRPHSSRRKLQRGPWPNVSIRRSGGGPARGSPRSPAATTLVIGSACSRRRSHLKDRTCST